MVNKLVIVEGGEFLARNGGTARPHGSAVPCGDPRLTLPHSIDGP